MSASPFSTVLRAATRDDHESAREDRYLGALLSGRLSREVYGTMIVQHYFVYRALDGIARSLADHPVAGAFVFPELFRQESLERDLLAVYGPRWRERLDPARPTRTLVARIEQAADWPGGYIAHHYTRYMGDLSGGRIVRRHLREIYGFERGGGMEFYYFDAIDSVPHFKNDYRRRLDELPVDEAEKQRIIRETKLAYQLNTEMLAALGRIANAA
jgi:heme oxygenase